MKVSCDELFKRGVSSTIINTVHGCSPKTESFIICANILVRRAGYLLLVTGSNQIPLFHRNRDFAVNSVYRIRNKGVRQHFIVTFLEQSSQHLQKYNKIKVNKRNTLNSESSQKPNKNKRK